MYQLTGELWIYRIDDQARIAPGHPDYQDYLTWVAAGNTPIPPAPEQLAEVRATMQCSDVQGRLALEQSGFAESFEIWANDPSRSFRERTFLRSTVWRRSDPILHRVGQSWGLTDDQIDDLFHLAVTL
jgi:hypothetical protein